MATTEIVTYGHTRSLLDALPIFGVARRRLGGVALGLDRRPRQRLALGELGQPRRLVVVGRGVVTGEAVDGEEARERRSEEHTSELQSLMRISYAVFCLQKKKHKKKSSYMIYNHYTTSKDS